MLKNFSLFQIIVLSSFGAFAVAGMIIFAVVVGKSRDTTIGDVTVWGTLDGTVFTTVLRQLAEDDSRFRSVQYVQVDDLNYERQVTDALASGSGPDMFLLPSDYAEKMNAKLISIPYASFSKEQFDSTFIEGADVFLGTDGVRAIPLSVDPLVLYWNKDMLGSAGFAKPPSYWDELFDIAANATVRSQTGNIERSGVAFGEYRNVLHAKDIVALLMLQAGGKITGRNSAGDLVPSIVTRSGDTQAPTEAALRFYTDFANPIKTHYSWNRSLPVSRQAFGAEQLALYIGYASEEPLLRRINPNLNFAVAPIPQIRDQAKTIDTGIMYALAIPKTSKNPDGALTIAYLLAGKDAATLVTKALGMPPARRDALAEQVTGLDDIFYKQAIIVHTWADPDPEKTNDIFRDMIESVTSGAAKLNEALQRADKAMGEIINGI